MKKGVIFAMVGTRYLAGARVSKQAQFARHLSRARRVMMTWRPPQPIRRIYGDHVPCTSTALVLAQLPLPRM